MVGYKLRMSMGNNSEYCSETKVFGVEGIEIKSLGVYHRKIERDVIRAESNPDGICASYFFTDGSLIRCRVS